MKKEQFDIDRSLIHPLFSIFIPFFFIVTYDRVINNVYSTGIPFYLMLLIVFSGVVEVVSGNFFENKFSSALTRVRECLYVLIIYGFLYGFIFKDKIYLAFYLILLVFFQWIMTFHLHKSFRAREMLFNDI